MPKKTSTALVVALTVFVMISIFLGGYIIYDKVISKEELKENNTEQKEETQQNSIPENNSEDVSESTEEKKICSSLMNATYYGEYHENTNNIHIYTTITFKDDGSFEEITENSEPIIGTYSISGNTLTTKTCPIYGPCEEEIITSREISEDCSTIKWEEDYNVNLQ